MERMLRSWTYILVACLLLSITTSLVNAQAEAVVVDRDHITVTGSIDEEFLSSSFTLTPSAPITNLQIVATDLTPEEGSPADLDPLRRGDYVQPSNTVGFAGSG